MKKIILKTAAILLILAGGFVSCGKENDIDFSNIENLYAQPLSVIQKTVQGRWKLYRTCGGYAGCSYPPDTFITIASNEIIAESMYSGEYRKNSYSWKKNRVDIDGNVVDSYVLWPDDADETAQVGRYFIRIQNDSLIFRSCQLSSVGYIFDFVGVRVK
jgi:hypothetical protein